MNNLQVLLALLALVELVVLVNNHNEATAMKEAAPENLQVPSSHAPSSFSSPRVLQVSSIDGLTDSIFRYEEEKKGGSDDVSVVFGGLEYDFYRHSCPQAEATIRSAMARVHLRQKDTPPVLLRLFFHDCFIKGCDASVLLDDSRGNKSHRIERQAAPNLSLKGFDIIDTIKEELEKACPGVVSCADILTIATRDGIVLSGGPFYPVLTGRRDSTMSYFEEAMADIPSPNGKVNETLRLFSSRGFNPRETVALLGGHSVGKISCDFVQDRLNNFQGTGRPDPEMTPDFLQEMRAKCSSSGNRRSGSLTSGGKYDSLYYKNLVRGRGILFSDQELMNDDVTRQVVALYASDDGTLFRRDFARSMVRLSNLNVLTGAQGQVRLRCSLPAS